MVWGGASARACGRLKTHEGLLFRCLSLFAEGQPGYRLLLLF